MNIIQSLLGLGIVAAFTYLMWWIVKSFSYWLFYESMVKDTVIQVLISQGLI